MNIAAEEQVKKFLSQNIELVDTEQYDMLYLKLEAQTVMFNMMCTPEITNLLLSCGVDPLLYLNYVPKYYRYMENSLTQVVIPENIEIIREHSFASCVQLKEIVLPEGLKLIREEAFKNCRSLDKIVIRGDKTEINPWAFIFINHPTCYINKNNKKAIEYFEDILHCKVNLI